MDDWCDTYRDNIVRISDLLFRGDVTGEILDAIPRGWALVTIKGDGPPDRGSAILAVLKQSREYWLHFFAAIEHRAELRAIWFGARASAVLCPSCNIAFPDATAVQRHIESCVDTKFTPPPKTKTSPKTKTKTKTTRVPRMQKMKYNQFKNKLKASIKYIVTELVDEAGFNSDYVT